MSHLLQFTMNVRKSHRQPQYTLLLACKDGGLIIWVDLHLSLCGQQHPNCERAIRLVYSTFYLKLLSSSSPTKKKKNLKELGLEILLNSSVSVAIQNFTHVHVNSLSHNDRCYCLSNYWPFLLDHPVFNYKYKQNTVKHNSISDFIKVYFLLCFVQRNVSALVMNHLQDDYFS